MHLFQHLGPLQSQAQIVISSYLFNCPDPSEKLWLTFPYCLLPLLLLPPLLMLCNGILQLNSKTKPNGTFHLKPTHMVSYHITKLLKICHTIKIVQHLP